ncbi:MAG TPA: hypothetical protein VFT22_14270 [Kofleriaceae bacterium]|nr:hypothetical protein [Kofleriaceae bacterium]
MQLLLTACGNDLGYGTSSANSGLPCDVQALLSDRCQGCHGAQLAGGAPVHLMSYDDLVATDPTGVTIAQRCLERMKSTSAQMPPSPASAATPDEIAMFEAWISAGAPPGDCTAGGGFGGPAVCTSGNTWTGGNEESPLMHPGRACISCHAGGEGPRFRIAGTVYPTGHEPDDCFGATSATVEITDATGHVTTLPVNSAGNFFTQNAIAFPIQVAVVANGMRRAMAGSPPNGDCNSCHTRDGANMAPGRIALP